MRGFFLFYLIYILFLVLFCHVQSSKFDYASMNIWALKSNVGSKQLFNCMCSSLLMLWAILVDSMVFFSFINKNVAIC
jgi:hypothetical protein